MPDNAAILQLLEQTLQQFHPTLAQKLNNGIAVGEIDKIASTYQVSFTDEVYNLFIWKNGISPKQSTSTDQLLIFPNGIPFTLLEAAQDYDLLSVTKHLFETNYFPLFSGGDENLLLIDLNADSPTYKTISLYSPPLLGNETPMTIYDSFSTMIQTAIDCYLQKAFWIDQDALQVDSDAHYNTISGLGK